MFIRVFGFTNPDINLKRMHQLYNVIHVLNMTKSALQSVHAVVCAINRFVLTDLLDLKMLSVTSESTVESLKNRQNKDLNDKW